jgi:hypothetical protein
MSNSNSNERRPVIVPTIHLNGTAPNDLIVARIECLDTLRAARKALLDNSPNARDWQYNAWSAGGFTPLTFQQAVEETKSRIAALDRIIEALSYEIEAIDTQIDRAQVRKAMVKP